MSLQQYNQWNDKLCVPNKKIRLIIDTDTKNEVDDQFAIAWALNKENRFSIEAIYAAPFHHGCFRQFNKNQDPSAYQELNGTSKNPEDGMEQSYEEILKILDIMDKPLKDRVYRGAGSYMESKNIPVENMASRDLVNRAMNSSETIYVAAIGAATNIASAILMEPKIKEKIVVVWLGGNELSFERGIEFNLIQDVFAAQVLFDSGVPLIWIPCNNVASMLSISELELKEKLFGKSKIGTYLAETVLEQFEKKESGLGMPKLLRESSLLGNNDQGEEYLDLFPFQEIAWSRIIWDMAAIAVLANPNWVPTMQIPSPILEDDYSWKQCETRHKIRVARYCYRDLIFGDLFFALSEN